MFFFTTATLLSHIVATTACRTTAGPVSGRRSSDIFVWFWKEHVRPSWTGHGLRSSQLSHAVRAPSPVHRLSTHHWGHLYHSEDGPPSRCVLEFRIGHDSTVCWNVWGHAARFVPDVARTFLDQHPTFVAIDDGADAMSTQQLHAPRARFRH
jgi:hypothetical protein